MNILYASLVANIDKDFPIDYRPIGRYDMHDKKLRNDCFDCEKSELVWKKEIQKRRFLKQH